MSKGTKQFRVGKLIRLIIEMEAYLSALNDTYKRKKDEYTKGQIYELEQVIRVLKNEFQIEEKKL